VWRVEATTDMLAAGREELRKAIAEIVKTARDNDRVDKKRAERWLKKLERGLTLKEGWPRYHVGLGHHNSLEVRFGSTNPNSIKREARRLRAMGLEEGVHFTVKMPEGEGRGYVSVLKEGLAYAAWLSENGKGEQRKLAARFVERILRRAEEAGKEVSDKASKIIDEGKTRAYLKLERFEKKVEVNGKTYVVKVMGGWAELEKSQSGKKLLRIRITAEVDGVMRDYVITYGRYGKLNAALGYAYARGDAPEVREADAERFSALVEALTGVRPWMRRRSGGKIEIVCGREHLDGFRRYTELADAIEKWLRETE
jgi:hypothetical protein